MNLRLVAFSLLFAIWVVVASWILVWLWPLTFAISFAAGWLLSNTAAKHLTGAYLWVFLLPLAAAATLFVRFTLNPMQDFGALVGQFALLHVAVALGTFAFIRHVARTQP